MPCFARRASPAGKRKQPAVCRRHPNSRSVPHAQKANPRFERTAPGHRPHKNRVTIYLLNKVLSIALVDGQKLELPLPLPLGILIHEPPLSFSEPQICLPS